MKRFKKILVAVDTRYEAHAATVKAVELAKANGASLKIVDVIPEIPWLARITLLDSQHLNDLVRKEKQEGLKRLADSIREQGIKVTTGLFSGKTSLELIREVQKHKHDLVVAVAKGRASKRRGFYGQTSKQLLRKCPCPVLLVTRDAANKFKHVLGCIDTSGDNPLDTEINNNVYELGTTISEQFQSKFSVVHAWSVWNESMLKNRLSPRSYEEHIQVNREHTVQLLDKFMREHKSSIQSDNVHLVKGDAHEVIPQFVHEYKVDLVVMGTIARSGLTGMVIGNTAERILDQLECSVLALKPQGFICPVVGSQE